MSYLGPKLYTPSTLNIDLILWQTQLIVCAENVKSWFKSWIFPFTFQAYILPHTLNCMCVSLFKFHAWILEQFQCCPKRPALPRHIKVWVSFELFGALYMYISALVIKWHRKNLPIRANQVKHFDFYKIMKK
jgi:hypothetical protein